MKRIMVNMAKKKRVVKMKKKVILLVKREGEVLTAAEEVSRLSAGDGWQVKCYH
jgi:hypothetical protein